jgi:hypothetical protein
MCATGDCQRMISGTMLAIEAVVAHQLVVFRRILVQRQHTAGDGVPGGVVTADDQQQNVAEILVGRHVFRRLTVHQHGNQVVAWLLLRRALLPHGVEVLPALPQFLEAFLRGLEEFGVADVLGGVGPVDQLVPVFLGNGE